MTNEINMMSRILSSHYVFYERLNDDDEIQEHKDLYKIVRNRMTEAADAASESRADVSFIYA
jgi:DNA-binding FadR family transcriptional regulator